MLLLSVSAVVHAAGLGKLVVLSSLGEPFRAEIEWLDPGDAAEPRLAAPADYAQAHYPYNAALAGARLVVRKHAGGRQTLEVTAIRPLNEPFVHVLLELTGPATRILRGYTVLLDPPGFAPQFVAMPAAAAVARTAVAVAPAVVVPPPPRNQPRPSAGPAPAAMSPDLSRRIRQLEDESAASAKTLADLMARIVVLEEIAQRLQRELDKPAPPAPAAKKSPAPAAPAATAAPELHPASRPQSFVNEALLVLAGGSLLLLAWLAWVVWGRPRRG